MRSVRNKSVDMPQNKALYQFVWYKDLNGTLLDEKAIAVAVYINFVALALHEYPAKKAKLEHAGEIYAEMFAEEVR